MSTIYQQQGSAAVNGELRGRAGAGCVTAQPRKLLLATEREFPRMRRD